MNREIKFRVWVVEHKRMFSFDEAVMTGIDVKDADGISYQSPLLSVAFVDNNGKIIALQYTGLKDKTGQEIYEGDILLFNKLHYEVSWCEDKWAAACPNYNRYHWPRFEYFNREAKCSERVGNIFETPELLKE